MRFKTKKEKLWNYMKKGKWYSVSHLSFIADLKTLTVGKFLTDVNKCVKGSVSKKEEFVPSRRCYEPYYRKNVDIEFSLICELFSGVRTKGRSYYVMTDFLYKKILTIEGEPPRCYNCGKILKPGSLVLTKLCKPKSHSNKIRRYCEKCRKELKIWV